MSKSVSGTFSFASELLRLAHINEYEEKYQEAESYLEELFQEAPNDDIVFPAISSLLRIWNKIDKKEDIVKKLDILTGKYPESLAGLVAQDYSVTLLSKQHHYAEALNRSKHVVAGYMSKQGLEESTAWSLYEQGLISTEVENQNFGLGKNTHASLSNCFKTILEKYPDSDAAENVREQFPDLPPVNDDAVHPEKYHLLSSYPNPFNPTTTISYTIPEDSHVEISIFDISGRLIETLINQNQNAGHYDIRWDASLFPSGVYLYQIRAGEFQQVRKMLLVK